jgi:hypothetical protein
MICSSSNRLLPSALLAPVQPEDSQLNWTGSQGAGQVSEADPSTVCNLFRSCAAPAVPRRRRASRSWLPRRRQVAPAGRRPSVGATRESRWPRQPKGTRASLQRSVSTSTGQRSSTSIIPQARLGILDYIHRRIWHRLPWTKQVTKLKLGP